MGKTKNINHVTLIVNHLEDAVAFYKNELGMEVIPAFMVDYPNAFLKVGEEQQLHLAEWEDAKSFRGHVCLVVEDFNGLFWRCKELGIIDIEPWGKVRQLPEGVMQMFIRDPSGNLLEISSTPGSPIDPAIFEDELFGEGFYVSDRKDFRGFKSEDASLYYSNND